MQFQSIIGQSVTKNNLVQLVQQNRLSHALLFLGKEGSGALQLAQAFAQYIVCEKVNKSTSQNNANETDLFASVDSLENSLTPTENINDSCGTCAACIKSTNLIHPDIHFSFPVITKKAGEKPISANFIKEWRDFVKENAYGNIYDWLQFIGAENKQGNITASECNEINHIMSLKSFESDYKILIMWLPEFLGKEGNKLLKLIEEPPVNTLFIFVAESEEMILPTILSRTQLVKIPLLNNIEIEEALCNNEKTTLQNAKQISLIAEGNYREALQILKHSANDWQTILRDWLNTILKTGPLAQIKWIDEVAKLGRENQKQFIKYFIHLLELAIRLSVQDENIEGNLLNNDDVDFANRLNKICNITQQEAIVNELNNASYYIERNANAKMLFHALSIKLYHIISNKSVILID